MVGKRKFDASSYEVVESSRRRPSRTSRRLSQVTASGADDSSVRTYNYLDNGDCECVCEHCAALFWFAERATCGSTILSPKYTHCCKRGAIRLPLPVRPPDLLRQLFDNDRFMENIRAYNNMFAMTSFGAQIDDAVNDGRVPTYSRCRVRFLTGSVLYALRIIRVLGSCKCTSTTPLTRI
ncbi:hypothetical protein CASFOL_040349 [Castilleja foliolosa]|uniref:Helitron helicase-like domain-containing protein n=1 Tax=Castilleja foliolosa TaxID=1961234 RepID=A0ABD3BF77_9LAMI